MLVLPLFVGIASLAAGGIAGPGLDYSAFSLPGVLLAALGLAVSHVAAYHYDYIGRGVYLTRSPSYQMFEPYPRLIVLHVTIIVAAWLVFGLGQPVLLVALMVMLKTIGDLVLYAISMRRGQPAAA